MNKVVNVFGASAMKLPEKYLELARELGALIGKQKDTLLFGGCKYSSTGELAKSAKENGAKIIAVTVPCYVGDAWSGCDKVIVEPNMATRKQKEMEISDSYITMPGGTGTIDEFFTVLQAKKAGELDAPLVLLDQGGFYKAIQAQIDMMIENGFAEPEDKKLFFVTDSPKKAMEYINNYGLEKSKEKAKEAAPKDSLIEKLMRPKAPANTKGLTLDI